MSDVLVALRALEPGADLLSRAGRPDHREPVARRAARGLARDDLDDVPRSEAMIERHDAPIDLRADRAMTDVGVDPVGEVDRGEPGRQALRRSLPPATASLR